MPFSGHPTEGCLAQPSWGIFCQRSYADRQAKKKQLVVVGSFHVCGQLSQLSPCSLFSGWKGYREAGPVEDQPVSPAVLVGEPGFCDLCAVTCCLPPFHRGAWDQGTGRVGPQLELDAIKPIGNAE